MSENNMKSGAGAGVVLAGMVGMPICLFVALWQAASLYDTAVTEEASRQAAVVEASGRAAVDYAAADAMHAITEIALQSAKQQQNRVMLAELLNGWLAVVLTVVLILLLASVVLSLWQQRQFQRQLAALTAAANGLLEDDDV